MSKKDPHDRLFKVVFSQVDQTAAFLSERLPPGLSRQLEWGSLRVLKGSFVDAALRERRTDLLFRVDWREGGRCLLYVLLEHQSKSDPWMTWRLLRYMVRIWERWTQEHPESQKLPVILPIVVYHGEAEWKGELLFERLLDRPPGLYSALGEHLPSFRFLLVDLMSIPDEEIPGKSLGRLALILLKRYRPHSDLWFWLFRLGPLLNSTWKESGLWALEQIFSYITQVTPDFPDEATFKDFLDQNLDEPEARDSMMNAAQKLHERGRIQGREEGREEGEIRFLLRLLERKYGPLSPEVVARVQSAGAEKLEVWSLRLLDAPDLQTVFR